MMKTFPENEEELAKLRKIIPYFLIFASLSVLGSTYIKFFVPSYEDAISPVFLILMPFALFGLWRVYLKSKKQK